MSEFTQGAMLGASVWGLYLLGLISDSLQTIVEAL